MERKIIKKIGTCKCKQYKQEINELNDIIYDLRQQLTPILDEINDFTLPNSFSEFDAQMEKIETKLNFETKFPSIEEIEKELNDINTPIKQEMEQELNEDKIKKIFYNDDKFDVDEFNKKFEQQQKPKEEDDILFKTKYETDGIEYKKNYNPNILPIKVITGFEKFSLEDFNKQFEEQTNVSYEF